MAPVVKDLPASAGYEREAGSYPASGRVPAEGNRNLVFLPGKSHGQRSLAGCSSWGRKESFTAEQLNIALWG